MSAVPPRAWLEGPCPRCQAGWRCPAGDAQRPACRACGAPASALAHALVDAGGALRGCLHCGHDQMYAARDFPRRLGLAVVIAAAALAPFTYYISLAAGALVDAGLVFLVRKRVHCYRCGAVHHGFARPQVWAPFRLEVADVHRFGSKASVVAALRPGAEPPAARRQD
ncbi:MAG: hypothetical protein EYC70_06215 [Planctomycetota bacterium]|nr:MAG: hypothetical protein EYC70_06215 [Planctomycetota bacterium]